MPSGAASDAARHIPVADRLAALRAHHNLSRSQLATLLHIAVTTIERWEAGSGRPRAAHIALLERLERDGPSALSEPPAPALPAPIGSFVGRAVELAALEEQIRASRLLTLTGPGGAGKTRLALELARRAGERFAHGVVLVELAGLTDAALLDRAVAAALGVREQAGAAPRALLIRRLRERRLLLLLDNCEHLLAAAAELSAALLHGCPGLQVLATSRESLGLAGENVWPVAPLSLPPAGDGAIDAVARSEAVQLFVRRAQERAPAFALTEANAASVAAICRRLDGLPLALELAAGWTRVLSPAQIAASLDERAPLPRSGGRDVPARHLSLDAAMAWSYALLDPTERRAFARLAVFSGGFTVEAMAAVCADPEADSGATLALLDRLVNKSLVSVAYDTPQPRLLLLETVHAYALARLRAEGDENAARHAHARFLTDLTLRITPLIESARQGEVVAQLEQERDNLRAALAFLAAQADPTAFVTLAVSLCGFYETRGYLTEGRATLDEALARCTNDRALHMWALFGVGRLAYRQSAFAVAQACAAECLPLAQELSDPLMVIRVLSLLGIAAHALGELDSARATLDEALQLACAQNSLRLQATLLNNLGLVASDAGDFAVARARFDAALLIASTNDFWASAAICLHNTAHTARRTGDAAEARADHLAALALFIEFGSRQGIAECLAGLALLAACQQHADYAVRLLAAAAAQFEAAGGGLSPSYQAEQAATVRRARAALGEAAYAGAWTAGGALSLDAAIALAWATPTAPPEPERAPRRESLPAVGPAISAREGDVLKLLAAGATNKEIARALGISVRTVESHLLNVYAKIGARGRADATAYALRHALVSF